MVPRVARSGSSSTLFGKTKSNEGEKPSGRRKGVVSCPPIPRPISDKRDKREKKRIFPKVYIFRFFRASRRSRPSPSFLLILSKKFMKEIPGNITFLSQIDRSRWEKSCVVFYSLILILCSSKNQYSGYVGGGAPSPSWLLTPLWTCQPMFHCVCARSMSRSLSFLKITPCFALLITFPSPIRRGRQSDFVKDRRQRKTLWSLAHPFN